MRNANGYGGIVNLGKKRRNPFGVRVTTGFTDDGKQIRKYIGYYKTRTEAKQALAEYNTHPFDVDNARITFEEMFDLWSSTDGKKLTDKNLKMYGIAFRKCTKIHKMPFKKLRKMHLQEIIDNSLVGYESTRKIKHLFGKLYTYAMENDIVIKDYSKFVVLPDKPETKTVEFEKEYLKFVLSQTGEEWDFAKVYLLTGMRATELLLIEKKNIFDDYMIGGIKTTSGKKRCIPIMQAIKPIIEKWKNASKTDMLVNISYSTVLKNWKKLIKDYTPHDCRHTLVSVADRSTVNQVAFRKIIGHKQEGITAQVYTHKNTRDLIKTMEELEYYLFEIYLKSEDK